MNLNEIYSNLEFKNLNLIKKNEIVKILNIRNEKKIRENMYTNHIISLKEHLNWVKKIVVNNKVIIYAVYYKKELIGSVGLSNIDLIKKQSHWSFYISNNFKKVGVAFAVEYKLIDLVFTEMKFIQLNCEVLEFNKDVIKLHKKFGFVDQGIVKKNIYRNNKKFNAIKLKLKKEDWYIKKNELQNKFKI
tara:strand:- start:121 stop:687 length:567 start_codon:yes stop_codon:yes gene_type:complete